MTNAVFVSNLSLSIDSSMLEDMFSRVGNVLKAVVQVDGVSGLSRGFGLVEMSTPEEARDCVTHFDGQRSEGTTLIVRAKDALTGKPVPLASSRAALLKLVRKTGLKVKRASK